MVASRSGSDGIVNRCASPPERGEVCAQRRMAPARDRQLTALTVDARGLGLSAEPASVAGSWQSRSASPAARPRVLAIARECGVVPSPRGVRGWARASPSHERIELSAGTGRLELLKGRALRAPLYYVAFSISEAQLLLMAAKQSRKKSSATKRKKPASAAQIAARIAGAKRFKAMAKARNGKSNRKPRAARAVRAPRSRTVRMQRETISASTARRGKGLGLPTPKGVNIDDDGDMPSKGRTIDVYRAAHDAKYFGKTLPAHEAPEEFLA